MTNLFFDKSRSIFAPTFLFFVLFWFNITDATPTLSTNTQEGVLENQNIDSRNVYRSKKTKKHSNQGYSIGTHRLSNSYQISVQLQKQLTSIISSIVNIHEYLKTDQISEFQEQVKSAFTHLKSIQLFKETTLGYHQKMYLNRQLSTLAENIQFLLLGNLSKQNQLNSLKKIYQELIHITHIYPLSKGFKQYGVYFCSKDDNVWMQKSNTSVYNPFGSSYRKCGRKIR